MTVHTEPSGTYNARARRPGPDSIDTVLPTDPQYADLTRGSNGRWVSTPLRIEVVRSPKQVLRAVRRAVDLGQRLSVRSGGHCYENFVDNPEVEVIIDLTELSGVRFDAQRKAVEVGAGAQLGEVYETLFRRWGVTIPGGSCPTVAAGGHVAGGGYGNLNKLFGLSVDHLYAVEVVVVDADGRASLVVATREPDDPHHELWWAHTGGGGGNLGVVTRYWFRTPGATGGPRQLLPRPPASILVHSQNWPWSDLSEDDFARLLHNYGRWNERNSGVDSRYAGIFSRFTLAQRSAGGINLALQADATVSGAAQLVDDFLAEMDEGVGVAPVVVERQVLPWWRSTLWSGLYTATQTAREDFKSAYLRSDFTERHVAAYYRNLSRTDVPATTIVSIASYGGVTNTVAPEATAVAQRDSIMKILYAIGWTDPAEDAANVAWFRSFYEDVYGETGGVPVPDDPVTDGCFVNYCDTDLSDPTHNRSGVPWSSLYYKGNYARLRSAKRRWDPLDVFRHEQSIEL